MTFDLSFSHSFIRFLAHVIFVIALTAAGLAQVPSASPTPTPAATPPPTGSPEIEIEEDPTKPVFFSIREEYRNLKNDAWSNNLMFRVDKFAFKSLGNKGGARGVVLRLDVPITTVHRGNSTRTGLGDIYGQALYVPYFAKSRRFAFTVGSGVVLPTATNGLVGQGKLIIAPLAVPVWYMANKRRFLTIKFQNFFSVAGKSSRPNVNYFVVEPTFAFRVMRNSWILASQEARWDWRTKKASAITGLQVGRIMFRRTAFWIKPEIPWGEGRVGDFTIKIGMVRYR